jgi:endoglucanase
MTQATTSRKPAFIEYGTGRDTVTISLGQDSYKGDAQYKVFVDGKQVGGIFTASALRNLGQSDTLTLHGDWGPGTHKVSIAYINDYRDVGGDRNLVVNSVAYNGNDIANSRQGLWSNGTFSVVSAPAPHNGVLNYGSGPDVITVSLAQDGYKGNAQYQILVDGKAIDTSFFASGSRRAGETNTVNIRGDWGSGPHEVTVKYINDYRDAGGDRNLVVNSIAFNGNTTANSYKPLWSNGAATFTTIVAPKDGTISYGTGPDALVLTVNQDVHAANAQYQVLVDGKAVGATFAASASHAAGATDTLTLHGDWGPGPHTVAVTYVNAPTGATASSLYVTGASLNGAAIADATGVLATTGSLSFATKVPVPAAADTTSHFDVGVNMIGPEYVAPKDAPAGWVSGIGLFPTHGELQYFAAKGMGSIRLALSWETLQPSLNGSLDPAYLAKIKATVADAKALGLDVILDIHNYGSYNGKLIGSADVPTKAFADLWSKLAGNFTSADNVKFDLMNEPQQATAADWLAIANSAIAAIRATGATQQVLIPGVHWDGGSNWTTTDNGTEFAKKGAIVDSANNYVIEIHQYLDNGSGTADTVISPTIGVERLTAVTEWARANGMHLYLGETGVANNAESLAALGNMMDFLKANQDVWTGVGYFAAGTSAKDYMYTVEPSKGIFDTAQMDVLENYTGATTTKTLLADGTTRVDTFGYGGTHASVSDILAPDGHLVSRSIYAEDGDLTSHVVAQNADTFVFDRYDDNGNLTAESVMRYQGSNTTVLKDTVYAADHSFSVKVYDPATGAVTHQEKHDSGGKLIYSQDDSATAHVQTNYVNGIVSQSATYDASWQQVDVLKYSTAGALTEHDYLNANGYHVIDRYDPATGKIVTQGVFDAAWKQQSWTTYNTDGSKSVILNHADGSKEIDYYAIDGHTYQIDQFAIDGHKIGSQMMTM